MTHHLLIKKTILRSMLVWGIMCLLVVLNDLSGEEKVNYYKMLEDIAALAVVILIFYTHFFICDRFFYRNRWVYAILTTGMLAVFLSAVVLFNTNVALPPLPMEHMGKKALLYIYLSLYFIIIILLSGFYWSVLYSGKKNKENAAMLIELKQMEAEKFYAEKKFLQSQINPHFLYNTLNYFYAKSLSCSTELSDGIMTLSEIMKYSLQKNENEKSMVLLEDEVAHLHNVIHIYQLRFNHKLYISFSVSGNMEKVRILPLTLITLVENALKHGDFHDAANPVQIMLVCDGERQKLFFSVYNKKSTGPKEPSTGIGIINTKKRMTWTYGNNFTFETQDENRFFKAAFSVPLLRDIENEPV